MPPPRRTAPPPHQLPPDPSPPTTAGPDIRHRGVDVDVHDPLCHGGGLYQLHDTTKASNKAAKKKKTGRRTTATDGRKEPAHNLAALRATTATGVSRDHDGRHGGGWRADVCLWRYSLSWSHHGATKVLMMSVEFTMTRMEFHDDACGSHDDAWAHASSTHGLLASRSAGC